MVGRSGVLSLQAVALAALLIASAADFASERAQASESLPCAALCAPPTKAENPDPNHSVLVIGLGWDTGDPASSSRLEPGMNQIYADYLRGHVNEWFAKSAPGIFQNWEVTPGGSYTIAPPVVPAHQANPLEPETGCAVGERSNFFNELATRAEAKVTERGGDPDLYTIVVFHWSQGYCFAGIQSGRRIGLTRPEYAMHELGHFYGLSHANTLRCKNAVGALVPLSANCTEAEYEDDYDAMGAVVPWASYNAVHTNQLGWLNGQFFDVSAGDFTGTWTLRPFTDPAHSVRALRLRDGTNTFWLEYRTPVGIEGEDFTGHRMFPQPGLLIHREVRSGGVPQSQLLDMTPDSAIADADFDDAPLQVGQTWVNPLGE